MASLGTSSSVPCVLLLLLLAFVVLLSPALAAHEHPKHPKHPKHHHQFSPEGAPTPAYSPQGGDYYGSPPAPAASPPVVINDGSNEYAPTPLYSGYDVNPSAVPLPSEGDESEVADDQFLPHQHKHPKYHHHHHRGRHHSYDAPAGAPTQGGYENSIPAASPVSIDEDDDEPESFMQKHPKRHHHHHHHRHHRRYGPTSSPVPAYSYAPEGSAIPVEGQAPAYSSYSPQGSAIPVEGPAPAYLSYSPEGSEIPEEGPAPAYSSYPPEGSAAPEEGPVLAADPVIA